jgi:regulation of enolase protein 1 (concanavalin A-like superfamily)
VEIAAGPRTDFFVDPGTGEVKANGEARLEPVEGDFVLSARVEVEFAATFDAGALLVWGDEGRWAKLAFELSPQSERMVVSVVTRERSDDCNSTVIAGDAIWLRVARIGDAYAFHSSTDGRWWNLVRHFHLEGATQAGFEAQSPMGDGCTATFTDIRREQRTLLDIRDGS